MRTIGLLALLGTLALAVQAAAAERVATFPANGRSPAAGPVPVGGEVAYGHRLTSGRWWIGTTARTDAVLAAPGPGLQRSVVLDASGERAAWASWVESIRQPRIPDPSTDDRLSSLGPPGSPEPVDDCPRQEPCRRYGTAYRFAIDGSTLAWLRQNHPGPAVLTIDHGNGSAPVRMDLGDYYVAGPVAAAGGRVAVATFEPQPDFAEGVRVRVLDRDGRELLHVDSSDELTFGPDHWALQPDGKLVIWARQGLMWFSPQEPYAHPLPTPPDKWYALFGAVDDRLAYYDTLPGSYVTRLRVLGFDGTTRTIARFPASSVNGVGFDGTTVAWSSLRCGVMGIWKAPADGSEPTWTDEAGVCPDFSARRPLLGRTRVVVRLQCPRGCRGTVSIAFRDARGKRIAGRRVAFRPSVRERIVRLPLNARARRTLREAGRFAPPVVVQRISGRDGRGDQFVAELARTLRRP